MGTIRVLREAAAHVELTLRLSLQAIGKIRKLLEAIYEIASRHLEKQQLPKKPDEGQIADKTRSTNASYPRDSAPSPNWKSIGLAVLFAALMPGILLAGINTVIPMPTSPVVRELLEILFIIFILAPIPLGGFWVGLAWPGRHLPAYILLGLGSATLGPAVLGELSRIGVLSLLLSAGELLDLLLGQRLFEDLLGIPISAELLGPTLMFVSGALFGDLREKRKSPDSAATDTRFAKAIANKLARLMSSGKDTSKKLTHLLQILGPSFVGLLGSILTIIFN
jgi:hypothetical protein